MSMKYFGIVFLSMIFFSFASCQNHPAKTPLDFSISIGSHSGLTGLSAITIISLDSCIDEERKVDSILTRHKWKVTETELGSLYQSLLELDAFDIKSLAYHGRSYDEGNTSVYFMINKKSYRILSSANNRIIKKDEKKYQEMLKLINDFVITTRK
ncbi:MAG: hypothetical protein HOP10_01415 [Chitinophagaceae bacterium]|nr:hypothetical protein [Chitinophagaceae bacterium]